MCTVSWLEQTDGYELFCNRDEKLTRPKAELPRIRSYRGVRCVCPIDPSGMGSWIGVNEFGVGICLLNSYLERVAGVASRGLLVRNLLHHSNAIDAIDSAVRTDLGSYAPFTLLVLEPNWSPAILSWDGRRKVVLPDAHSWNPLTSSSVDQAAAAAHRRGVFPRRRDAESLLNFHRSHEPAPGAYSACMHRDDAQTVSFSRVSVTASRVQFDYAAGPPCTADLCSITSIRRNHAFSTRAFHAAC